MNDVEKRIGYRFKKIENLVRALTHKSFANENKSNHEHNEKLEFLGDAVLDLVVGEVLFEKFPKDTEGGLSKKRASIVNEEVLSEIAQRMKLNEDLQLGKGELLTGGAQKPRLLASAFEALVGAVYLDGGFDVASVFIRREFEVLVDSLKDQGDFERDYKTRLQEVVQKKDKSTPKYELIKEEGPPHDRMFYCAVLIGEHKVAEGTGKSKKIAEQMAAKAALEQRYKGIEDGI